MIRHVAERASRFGNWTSLHVTSCDQKIIDHLKDSYDTSLTSDSHTRALDRVAEHIYKCPNPKNDICMCQGDEPLLQKSMIQAVIQPIIERDKVKATVLAMPILKKEIWLNPDTVKLIFNEDGKVLYTSRAPLPYAKTSFDEKLGAHRIVGIFAFEWSALKEFTEAPESRLEKLEACDSNRIFELSFDQYIAPVPYSECYSVDSPSDITLVETVLKKENKK